jgi:hypothetical protein
MDADSLGRPPLGYAASGIEVDWNHPLLAARLIDAVVLDRENPPPPLDRAETDDPGVLRIQLAEPVEQEGLWRPALPLIAPGDAVPFEPSLSWFALGDPGRWLPGGAAIASEPESASPLAGLHSARMGTRWSGMADGLEAMPSLDFVAPLMISLTQPALGRTRFVTIERSLPGDGRLGELRAWLADSVRPDAWIGVHAMGEQAWVAMDGWRLVAPPPRRIERLGNVLELRALRLGEPVDWARLPGAQVTASSWEGEFPPLRVIQGGFWPLPLDPQVWIGKPTARPDDEAWLALELDPPRPVETIRVVWADAAGWSAEARPGHAVLEIKEGNMLRPEVVAEWAPPGGPVSDWRAGEAVRLSSARIRLPEPSSDPLDGRPRVARVQLIGPWDGRTGAP